MNDKKNKLSYAINQEFKHVVSGDIYIIKGAWDGRFPNNHHAFMMHKDGTGHTYSGDVTKVENVWNISEKEFKLMCGDRPDWFISLKPADIPPETK
jgi:hypothetical protein